jgi:hypothetical protein
MGNSSCMPVVLWHSLMPIAAFPPLQKFPDPGIPAPPCTHSPAAVHLTLSPPVGARNTDPRLFQRCRMCRMCGMCRMPSPVDAPRRHIPCASTKMGLAAGGCSFVLVVVAPKGSNARDLLYIADSRCIGRFPSPFKRISSKEAFAPEYFVWTSHLQKHKLA